MIPHFKLFNPNKRMDKFAHTAAGAKVGNETKEEVEEKREEKTRIPQTINQKPFKHKLNDGRKKYDTYETHARNDENVFSFTHFDLRLVCAWPYLCAHSWSYVCKKKTHSY